MSPTQREMLANPLLVQLRWFISLRWVAGLAVVAVALLDRFWLHWYQVDGSVVDAWIVGVGGAILVYNALLRVWVRRLIAHPRHLIVLSWTQILLDLACLTVLVLWAGGPVSPFLLFFVFHMVFTSLLLPQRMAYGGALVAIIMVVCGLWLYGTLPGSRQSWLMLAGWGITLLLTVYLANHITRSIQRQWRRLARQNSRIRRMSRRLRLQQQAMIQGEKMAALGQMAAGVAHEISNPLAGMDSLLQLIQRHPERQSPDQVSKLREQIERIKTIIRQMHTFSHPSQTEGRTVVADELIDDALRMLQFDRRLKRVEVRREPAQPPCRIHVQPEAVHQVLVNLVINALDAMEDRQTRILTVRTRRDGRWCLIDIIDTGHGIPDSQRNRLFEPFFTTKPVGKGTGLGLAISYGLVSKQGGRIEVQSQPETGTTFTVYLPVADAAASAK
ncbi:MAG: Adaptive-response sensory-kinase SasA [Phycisphaerae bacterium]|nr:Adaptive-response sensory-kinase SasA [Phycisphaerae bacterium]